MCKLMKGVIVVLIISVVSFIDINAKGKQPSGFGLTYSPSNIVEVGTGYYGCYWAVSWYPKDPYSKKFSEKIGGFARWSGHFGSEDFMIVDMQGGVRNYFQKDPKQATGSSFAEVGLGIIGYGDEKYEDGTKYEKTRLGVVVPFGFGYCINTGRGKWVEFSLRYKFYSTFHYKGESYNINGFEFSCCYIFFEF